MVLNQKAEIFQRTDDNNKRIEVKTHPLFQLQIKHKMDLYVYVTQTISYILNINRPQNMAINMNIQENEMVFI